MMKKVINSKKVQTYLFGSYTYLERILSSTINVLPKTFRKIFYKIFFASFGKKNFIDEACYFRYPWKIYIGNNITINRNCQFFPSLKNLDAKIILQDGVILGPNVVFFGAGQDPINPAETDLASSIVIGKNTYIGGNSVIRYGVKIGDGSVIGAGSVVVAEVPANSVYAGNPAKFIRAL